MALITNFRNDGFLIMDASYLVHTIAFRTMNIYSEHFDLPDDPRDIWKIDFSLDEDFMAIFNRNIISTINKFLKKYNLNKQNIIFAMDCRKSDIWRRSIFESYKLNRIKGQTEPEGLNRGPLFKYVRETLLPSLVENNNMGTIIEYPIAEGDDIIAIAKMYIRAKNPTLDIVIVAYDHDFLQLLDDHTIITNIQEKLIKEKSLGSNQKDLLYKILIGDGSDEIPGCFKKTPGDKHLGRGFGQKTCLKFIENPDLLRSKLIEYPEAAKQMKINRQIVDFNYIPESIKTDIESKLDNVISVYTPAATINAPNVVNENSIHNL